MNENLAARKLVWYDVNVKPLDVCVPEGTKPRYEETLAGEYLVTRLDEIYG